jgi:hypothetical protein
MNGTVAGATELRTSSSTHSFQSIKATSAREIVCNVYATPSNSAAASAPFNSASSLPLYFPGGPKLDQVACTSIRS